MATPVQQFINHMDGDERANWLTFMIKEMWPFISSAARDLIQRYIPPALQKAVPTEMLNPTLTKIDLGNETPTISSVFVREAVYTNGSNAIVMEAQIDYVGRPDMILNVGPAEIGINKIELSGRLEIILRPILDRIPVFGAVQIGFINKPHLDYTPTGIAAYTENNFTKNLVREAVNDLFGKSLVLPNRLSYLLEPATSYFTIASPILAVVRVAVIRGHGFPSTDKSSIKQFFGISEQPDVYITLRYGSQVYTTERVDNCAKPVWQNQLFDFVATTNSIAQQLQIEAHDFDVGIDDYLGKGSCSVGDLVRTGSQTIYIEDSPEGAKPWIEVMASWLPVSSSLPHIRNAIISHQSDKTRPENCSELILSVDIGSASNLPTEKQPYVEVKVGKRTYQTNPIYEVPEIISAENPDFWQSFHLPLAEVDGSTQIHYNVKDFISGASLGFAFSSISDLVMAGSAGRRYCFALLRSTNPNASLSIRLRLAAVLESEPLWRRVPKNKPCVC